MAESLDKIQDIDSIVNFDLEEIDRLIKYSNDDNLIVRYHAYCKLNSDNLDPQILSKQDWELLPSGVVLNPGDIVWSVYQSGMTYDDEKFSICDYTDYSGKQSYGREINDGSYDLWNRGVLCKLVSRHVERESAEAAANEVIKTILSKEDYLSLYNYDTKLDTRISQQDIYDWVKIYNIPNLPQPHNPEPFNWVDNIVQNYNSQRYLKYQQELHSYCDQLRYYTNKVLEKLTIDKHYEVVDLIYMNVVGRLAYICKETVRESTYFKP
jgi:hypothetical protein